ncbi:mediator of RNA polymerase II transcription subunit 15a-like [Eucalyptus grandis]|uniref:mediator of RNA polymerase II transcription subunit 15a-like n=1 Tax=Eucalyptus grandis TaxID=71139 RepID=UPI00192EA1AE|nr:mediator of RNA polymerase II transcription subunit 15a-like [Eucalyptus grandis]
MMDNNDWRPTPPAGVGGGGTEAELDGGDWRAELPLESRDRVVKTIMETLKRHLPVSGPEGLQELKKIAVRFEEKIYTAATSQSDYLRKISLKMLTMETKSQNTIPNASPSNPAGNSSNDPVMQSQIQNQSQSIPNSLAVNQPQARQQLLVQNIQNNVPSGVQASASLSSTLPSVSGLNQSSIPNTIGQNNNMQNMPSVSQNSLGNSMGQGVNSNMFVNSQQLQARQQMVSLQQQQQSQNSQQYIYQQQQYQQQLLKQKLQPVPHLLMSSQFQQQQQQQQQQNMLQPTQLQASRQSVLQTSSVMQPPSMQPAPLAGLQQNQQSSIPQSTQSMKSYSSTFVVSTDSSAQMGHSAGVTGKRRLTKRHYLFLLQMKSMRDTYLPELNEMYQKISMKLQQHESLPLQPKSDQLDKLKNFKLMLERVIAILQVNKADIVPSFKEKLVHYDKQIRNFINTNRPRKVAMQQGQLAPPHVHSMQQQQQQQQLQPQTTQVQSHENQMNPQLESMNLQGSVASMQQNNMGNLNHYSMSLSGVSNAQQTMIDSLQPNSNMDSGTGNASSTMQVIGMGSMQQNPVAPQQVNMSTMQQQGGVYMLQSNVNKHQSNSNMLQCQPLKQQQEQQMLQTQQLKQQYQQPQMQQQLKQQLLQQQLQQAKQQLPWQLQTHQRRSNIQLRNAAWALLLLVVVIYYIKIFLLS